VAAMAPQVAMELSSGSYKSMWYYYQEDQHWHLHSCEKLKSHKPQGGYSRDVKLVMLAHAELTAFSNNNVM
jgi:hypothetical protein